MGVRLKTDERKERMRDEGENCVHQESITRGIDKSKYGEGQGECSDCLPLPGSCRHCRS